MTTIDPHTLDSEDSLKWARDEFEIPLKSDSGGDGTSNLFPNGNVTMETLLITLSSTGDGEVVYLCGNSLGLLPKQARKLLNEEIDVWSKR